MKAAVCRAFGEPLTIEEVTLAEPAAGEVRVKLNACAICHSDVSYAEGIWGGDLPAVYGHEGAGIVESVGDGVTKCSVGDHVIATLVRYCGECHYCEQKVQPLCEGEFALANSAPIRDASGNEIVQGLKTGAFAEAVVVDQSQIEVVPQDMPSDVASLLACGVLTGYGAVTHASDLKAGEHAIIIGCGGVGLNSIQGASLKGAKSVIALDLDADKRELVMDFGATHALDPTDPATTDKIMEITEGRGADYVFITVGAKSAIESAQNFITKTGTIVIVGMTGVGVTASYEPLTLADWGQKIVGSKMGNTIVSVDVADVLALYKDGKYKLDPLISGRFKLEEINEALAEVKQGKAIKNVIMFD